MISLEEQLTMLIDSISQKERSVSVSGMKDATKACEELLLWIELHEHIGVLHSSEYIPGRRTYVRRLRNLCKN